MVLLSSQLKALIDKFYSFEVGEKSLKIKEAFLLTCGELDDKNVFKGLVESYEQLCKLQGWQNKGTLIVPSVLDIEDIEKTGALEKVSYECEKTINNYISFLIMIPLDSTPILFASFNTFN